MKIPISLYIILTSLCCAAQAQAQEYIPEIHHYSVKDGLSDREVNCILQDRQGYLWIGTRAGLNRFDGYHFRIWTKEDGLSGNIIAGLFEDAYGYIWITDSDGNITLMDPGKLTLKPIDTFYSDKIPGGISRKGYRCFLTKDSTLYLSDRRSFKTFHPRRGFRDVRIQAAIADTSLVFTLFFVSTAKTIWGTLRSPKGTNIVELDNNGIVLQQVNVPRGSCSFVATGRHPEGSVNYFNMEGEPPVCLKIDPDNTTHLLKKNTVFPFFDYEFFLASLALFNKDGPLFSDFRFFDLKHQDTLINLVGTYEGIGGIPRGLVFDRSGKLWMGSRFGMVVAEFQPKHFNWLLYSADEQKLKISCRGIIEKNGHLLINTESGIYCDGKFFPVTSHCLHGVCTAWFALATDGDGNLYSGSSFNLESITDVSNLAPHQVANVLYPWAIFPDAQHRFWIGTNDGLSVFDLTTQKLIPFEQYNGFDELKKSSIIAIQPDREGNIWLCAASGFYRLDFEKGIMERHWTGGKDAFYLPCDNFTHSYEDPDGIFWLATLGGGLIRWDRKNGSITQYSTKNGFSSNSVYAVYEDDHQHLWLPSDDGIIQFDKTSATVRRIYHEEDGITDHEFNRISHYRGHDGTLYFGGLNGVTAFNPNDFYANDTTALTSLVLSKYSLLDGNRYQLEDKTAEFSQRKEIILYPGFRYFELEFAMLTFTSIDRIQYYYKIEGVDKDWLIQSENHLRINYLPYGNFHLRIRAKGPDGLWAANELDIPIHVIRPFWLTWWFFLLCAMALAGLIYAWFRYRLEQAIKIERLRVQISSDLHDDVGTLLAGLAMQSEALELSAKGKDKNKLQRISEISRNAMTHMRDTVWAIDARKDKLENLLDRMREHAEETLTLRDIRFDLLVENLSLKQNLPTNIRQNIYLIYKEAITNAAKHTNGDLVAISLKKLGNGFEMRICDNGTIAEKGYKTTGLGTSNMHMRAAKMGGKLEITRNNGFCVTLSMRDLG